MTSIEWLIQEVEPYGTGKFRDLFKEVIEQAKLLHKQEMGDTWDAAIFRNAQRGYNASRTFEDFDEYYQETFVSKGSDECHFAPTTNTSSATICKHCGKEKYLHTT